jgi:hypothetical protein
VNAGTYCTFVHLVQSTVAETDPEHPLEPAFFFTYSGKRSILKVFAAKSVVGRD